MTARIARPRKTAPIPGRALLSFRGETVGVHATDLDAHVTMTIEAQSPTGPDADVTVAPHLVLAILPRDGLATLALKDGLLTVEADGVAITLRDICAPADFPHMKVPAPSEGTEWQAATMPEAALRRALATALGHVCVEKTRYYLNGVRFSPTPATGPLAGPAGLRLQATNGHVLAVIDTRAEWGDAAGTLPRGAAQLLLSLLRAGGNAAIEIGFLSERMATFRGDGWSLAAKLIDGTWPDTTRVWPTRPPLWRATLTGAALHRLPNFGLYIGAIIDPTAGRVTVGRPKDDFSATAPVEGAVEGVSFAVMFNLGYLRSIAGRTGAIRIETASASGPAVVLTDDPDVRFALMPMRLP